MIYTLIVTSNHLTNGQNALQVATDLLSQQHTIKQIYFVFDGAYVANRFIDMPTDEFDLTTAWREFAQQHKVPLNVCSASGLRRGISKESIAQGFMFGSIGEMLTSCNASDRVLTL